MKWSEWQLFIQNKTQIFLTKRKRRKLIKKEKQKRRNPVLEWVFLIIEVIFIVILINIFLFQNYRIPSTSMVPELEDGDLIFVEKISFGAELLPGIYKLAPLRLPVRGEVISFESNLYAQDGPFMEYLKRLVFLVTLTLVNMKVDENGNPIPDLLIKRTIGLPRERIRETQGRIEIMPEAENEWITEQEMQRRIQKSYILRIPFVQQDYERFQELGRGLACRSFKLYLDQETDKLLNQFFYPALKYYNDDIRLLSKNYFIDFNTVKKSMFMALHQIQPNNTDFLDHWNKIELGWYIPATRFFPLGDNRFNSKDARYYGPFPLNRIQGKALIRFWPFARLGTIN